MAIPQCKSEIASLASCFRKKARARNDVKDHPAKTGEPSLLRKAGVTLVELIMALVILAVIAIPAAMMIGAQVQGMVESTDFTAAGNLARREMETLTNIAYASIANGSAVSGSYTVSWTVSTVAGGGGAERKDITMTAQRTGSASTLVTLYSSKAKDVTYGL